MSDFLGDLDEEFEAMMEAEARSAADAQAEVVGLASQLAQLQREDDMQARFEHARREEAELDARRAAPAPRLQPGMIWLTCAACGPLEVLSTSCVKAGSIFCPECPPGTGQEWPYGVKLGGAVVHTQTSML